MCVKCSDAYQTKSFYHNLAASSDQHQQHALAATHFAQQLQQQPPNNNLVEPFTGNTDSQALPPPASGTASGVAAAALSTMQSTRSTRGDVASVVGNSHDLRRISDDQFKSEHVSVILLL